MKFYTQQHDFYCGIDLHARTMYLCVLNKEGQIVLHKNMESAPGPFLAAIAPYRGNLVVGVECMFCWYWMADLCAREQIAFILGHALYMKAIHGGKAKNDKIDAHKIAGLMRGGMFPQAYVYPAEMRSTRDLLRRRMYLVRQRADLLAHIHNTNSQYNLPAIGQPITRKKHRGGVVERFADAQVQQSVQLDFGLIEYLDKALHEVELTITRLAKQHDPAAFKLLRSVHGIGPILALVILYEIHVIQRFPTVQNFASYSRLVKCSKESAGKLYGFSGNKIGNAFLKWAFSEAAVLFLRANPPAQKYHARLVRKHGKGKALSIIAHRLGRAVYHMLSNGKPFDSERFFKST
jgi:transposase